MSRQRAVVLGASMAGLCAARVLSDHFAEVVLIERDSLGTGSRPHVPQGQHPHLLLHSGASLLEHWFPGIQDELARGGAVPMDLTADLYWHQGGGVATRPRSALRGPSMTRPFLEATVRDRVLALTNVQLKRSTATGIRLDGDRVVAVRLADQQVAADLVVDATGRAATSVGWMAEAGFAPPTLTEVRVDTRYVTRVYRREPDPTIDWKAAGVIGAPESCRTALVLPVEGERWLLVFAGLNGHVGPLADDEVLTYAKSLESPVIAELVTRCEQVGAAATYRFITNQRRHVEKLRSYPLGWLLLGDAVCSFDPIYGQGMSSAALQADALGRCLSRATATDRTLSRAYFKAVAKVVAVPWSIAVGGDFAYAGTTGPKPVGTDLANRWFDLVIIAGQVDDDVTLRVNEVLSLERGAGSLFTPAFVARVLRGVRNRRRRRCQAGRSHP